MSWLYSRALVEEFSRADCLAGALSVPLNSTPTPQAYLWHVKTTATWNRFPSATTLESLTDDYGADLLTWFRADFLAKTSPKSAVMPKELTESKADSGAIWRGLYQTCTPDLFSSKTPLSSSGAGLSESLETFPQWGMLQSGVLSERMTPALPTAEKESGLWATPSARDWKDTPGMSRVREKGRHRIDQLPRQVYASLDGSQSFIPPTATETETALSVDVITQIADVPGQPWRNANTPIGGGSATEGPSSALLNPEWVEWLMGWPIGWTALTPLAMDRFRQWQDSHLKS